MADRCIHLLCPLAMEERLLDALLTLGAANTFTSSAVNVHGHDNGGLDTTEQVTGRRACVLVQLLTTDAELQGVLARLRSELTSTGVRFWVTPVLEEGDFQ